MNIFAAVMCFVVAIVLYFGAKSLNDTSAEKARAFANGESSDRGIGGFGWALLLFAAAIGSIAAGLFFLGIFS